MADSLVDIVTQTLFKEQFKEDSIQTEKHLEQLIIDKTL